VLGAPASGEDGTRSTDGSGAASVPTDGPGAPDGPTGGTDVAHGRGRVAHVA
jgi:hypothetical protein